MSDFLVPFVAAMGVALVSVPLSRLLARRLGFVARPREDRWHRKPVALLGGVGIAVAFFATVGVFADVANLAVFLACSVLIFLVGLLDDVLSLKPATKLIAQIAIASVLLFFRYRLNWSESLTLDMLFTLVWVVGLTNAFNLLDNMDGLCAGIALIVAAALIVNLTPVEAGTAAADQMVFLAALAGAAAGFLVFNFHPASIFMGDSGSLLLGFSLAALTLSPGQEKQGIAEPLTIVAAPVLVLLIPIFDTTLVTLSRLLSGRSPAEGGKDHSSHRLVAMGLSERAAVLLLWFLAISGAAAGLALEYFNVSWSGLVAAVFLLAMVLFAVYLGSIRVYEEVDPEAVSQNRLTPIVTELVYK
ncbi:MAG: MraY family glycosyltransferase, partial [Vicinamibacterales bacterium]